MSPRIRVPFTRRRAVAAAAIAAALATTATMTAASASSPDDSIDTLVIGGGDVDHIDMVQFHSVSARLLMANVYTPFHVELFEPDPDVEGGLRPTGEFDGGVTERIELSEDGLTGTLRVREGATFASGEPVTSEDLAYTLRRVLAGPGYTVNLGNYLGVDNNDIDAAITVVDDSTVQINFVRQSAMLDKILAFTQIGIVDASVAEENAGADGWASEFLAKNATASGPYDIVDWVPGQYVDLVRSDNTVLGPTAQMDEIRLQVIPDQSQRLLALKSGEIDIALDLPPDLIADAAADPDLRVYQMPSSAITYLAMNNQMAPLDDPVVRQAISHAIPYEALIQTVMRGYGQPAGGPLPEPIEGSVGTELAYEFDPDKARALLDEHDITDLEIVLTVNAENAQHVQGATFIQDELRKVGINVDLQTLPGAEYTTRLNAGELQMSINSWYSYGEDPFYQLQFVLGTGAFTNYARYSNTEVDELIGQGFLSTDPEARAAIARRAQEIVIEEAPWGFLYTTNHIIVTRADITGVANTLDKVLRLHLIGRE